jgi:hypothetical protein
VTSIRCNAAYDALIVDVRAYCQFKFERIRIQEFVFFVMRGLSRFS